MSEEMQVKRTTVCEIAAKIVRGVLIGVLLFSATTALILTSSGASIFRYQGF